jgi:hypothetical protein
MADRNGVCWNMIDQITQSGTISMGLASRVNGVLSGPSVKMLTPHLAGWLPGTQSATFPHQDSSSDNFNISKLLHQGALIIGEALTPLQAHFPGSGIWGRMWSFHRPAAVRGQGMAFWDPGIEGVRGYIPPVWPRGTFAVLDLVIDRRLFKPPSISRKNMLYSRYMVRSCNPFGVRKFTLRGKLALPPTLN